MSSADFVRAELMMNEWSIDELRRFYKNYPVFEAIPRSNHSKQELINLILDGVNHFTGMITGQSYTLDDIFEYNKLIGKEEPSTANKRPKGNGGREGDNYYQTNIFTGPSTGPMQGRNVRQNVTISQTLERLHNEIKDLQVEPQIKRRLTDNTKYLHDVPPEGGADLAEPVLNEMEKLAKLAKNGGKVIKLILTLKSLFGL